MCKKNINNTTKKKNGGSINTLDIKILE